jgi:hypothetical protein
MNRYRGGTHRSAAGVSVMACALAAGCSAHGTAAVRPADNAASGVSPAVFLLKSYAVNSGWGQSAHGCCLASDGTIARYRYTLGQRRPPAQGVPGIHPTPAQLIDSYCPGATVVGHIEQRAAADAYPWLLQASVAPVEEESVRFDAPDAGVDGFLPNTDNGQYRQVILSADGNIRRRNKSPVAPVLLSWLQQALSRNGCPAP